MCIISAALLLLLVAYQGRLTLDACPGTCAGIPAQLRAGGDWTIGIDQVFEREPETDWSGRWCVWFPADGRGRYQYILGLGRFRPCYFLCGGATGSCGFGTGQLLVFAFTGPQVCKGYPPMSGAAVPVWSSPLQTLAVFRHS